MAGPAKGTSSVATALLDVAAETQTTARPPIPPLGHVPILDSVRGVAILAVMAFHATAFTMDSDVHLALDRMFFNITGAGWCGVDLFFVLSGCLITRILLHTKTQEGYFQKLLCAPRTAHISALLLRGNRLPGLRVHFSPAVRPRRRALAFDLYVEPDRRRRSVVRHAIAGRALLVFGY